MQTARSDASPSLLSSRDIKKFAPVSDMTLWRWIKSGDFPQPIKIARKNYFRSDEVNDWLERKSAERNA